MSRYSSGGYPAGNPAKTGGSKEKSRPWAKRFVALAITIFFLPSAVSFSLAPSVSAASPDSVSDRGQEQLTGEALNGSTIEVTNSGSVTAIVTAYVKKAGGKMKYHNIDDITLIPGETTEIKVNGLADGVGVVSKRGFIYPIDTTTVIRGRTEPGAPVTVSGSPVIDKTYADEEGRFELVVPVSAVEGNEHEFHIIAGDAVKPGQFGPNDKSQGWMGFKEGRVIETVELGTTKNVGEIDLEFDPLEVQYDLSSAVADFSEEIGAPDQKVIEKNGKEIHRITRRRNVNFEGWKSEGKVKISFERIHNFPEDEDVILGVNDYSDLEDVEIADHPGLRAVERGYKEGSFSISAVPKSLGAVGSLKASIHAGGRKVFDLGEEIEGDDLPEEWKEWLDIGLGKDKVRFKAPRVLKNRWSETNVKTVGGKYKFTKVQFERYGPGDYGSERIPIEIRSGGEGEKFEGKVRLSITGADPSLNAELADEEVYVGEGGEVNTTLRISPDNPEKGGKSRKAVTIMAEEVNPDGSEPLSVEMGVVVNLEATSKEVEDEISNSWYEWFDLDTSGRKFEGGWDKNVSGHRVETEKKGGKYFKERFEEYSYSLRDWQTASIPISVEGHNFDGRVKLSVDSDSGLDVSLSDSNLGVHSRASTTMRVTPTVSPNRGKTLMRDIDVYAQDANPPDGAGAIDREKLASITIVVPDKGPAESKVNEWQEWFDLDTTGHRFTGSWSQTASGHKTKTSLVDSGRKYLKRKYVKYSYSLRSWRGESLPVTLKGHNFNGKVRLSVSADPGITASLEDTALNVNSTVSTNLNVKPTIRPSGADTKVRRVKVYAWDANPPGGVGAIDRRKIEDITIIVPSKGPDEGLVGQWKEWFDLSVTDEVNAWNRWKSDSFSSGWSTVSSEEKTQTKEFMLEDYGNWMDAYDAAEGWASKGDTDVTTRIELTGYIHSLAPGDDYRAPLEGTPDYINLPSSDYEPEVNKVKAEGKVVSWLEERSRKYETKDAAQDKYIDLTVFNTSLDPIFVRPPESETDYSEPIEWGAGWWEKDWHFESYDTKAEANRALQAVKNVPEYAPVEYYGEKMYPDKYKAKWYTEDYHWNVYDSKRAAERAAFNYGTYDGDVDPYKYEAKWYVNKTKTGWFDSYFDASAFGDVVDSRPSDYEYKAKRTTWEDRSSRQYDDWSDAYDKKRSLEKKAGVRNASIEYIWDDTEDYVKETKWFDDKNDHSGTVVDTDYKIKWTTRTWDPHHRWHPGHYKRWTTKKKVKHTYYTYKTVHHKKWISGHWKRWTTRKRVRHTYHYWTRKKVCNWHWSWWRGLYRTCHYKRVRETGHYYTYKTVPHKKWISGHWKRWTTRKRVRHTYYTYKTVHHKRWISGHWEGGWDYQTHTKWFDHRSDHDGTVVDKRYKIKWWHWEGGYDYKVKYEKKEHHYEWFDSYFDASAFGDVVDSRPSDYEYKAEMTYRDYDSTTTYTESYADYLATKGDRHKVHVKPVKWEAIWKTRNYDSDIAYSMSRAESLATKGDRHKVYVKPVHWQVEYYERDWKYKDGFKSESAAKDAYSEWYKHGGRTYATDWGVDWTVSWDIPHEKKYVNSDDAWNKYYALDGKDGIKNLDIESKKVSVGYKAKRYGEVEKQEKTTYTYSWKEPWYQTSTPETLISAEGRGTNGHAFGNDVELDVVDSSDGYLKGWLNDGRISSNGYDTSTLRFGGKTRSHGGVSYEVASLSGTQWVKVRGKDANGPLSRTKKVKLNIGTKGHNVSNSHTRTRHSFSVTGAPDFTARLTKREVKYGDKGKFLGLIPVGLELRESPPKIIIKRGDRKWTIWAIGGIKGKNAWADIMPRRNPYEVVINLKSMQTGKTVRLSFILNPEGKLLPKAKHY